jgi:O-antigen/teichoic acid export membrane protein
VSDEQAHTRIAVAVPDSEAVAPAETAAIARDAGLAVGARILAMACSSITAIVVAATLAKSEYGAYAIIFGIQVVLVMALDLGLTSALARYVAQGRATTALVVRVALLRLAIIGVAATVLLAMPHVPMLAGSRSLVVSLLPVLAALVVAQSLVAFHFGLLPSLRRIRLLLVVTVAQPVVELVLVLLARAQGGGAQEMILATVVAGLVVSTLAWVLLLAPGRAAARDVPIADDHADHAHVSMVAAYGRRIFLVSLLIAVFGQVDQFVIGAFRPLAEVAPYALALKVQALLAAPAITIAGIVAPRIAGAGASALVLYRQWLAFLAVLTFGAVLTISVLSRELFGAIDAQYRDDWPLLAGMGGFLLLSALAPLPSITLNQTGLAARRLRIAAITLAVNVVLDLALVPWLGAWGAVVATTVAFTYYFLRHDRLLEHHLAAQADPSTPSIRPVLARGVAMSVAVAALALVVRAALHTWIDDPSDVLVLLVAGGVAAIVHVAYATRIVRRPLA